MAFISLTHIPAVFPRRGRGPARGLLSRLMARLARVADARRDYADLARLAEASDAQLAAQGLERTVEMRRILGIRSVF